jgi:putative transposase
VYVTGFTDDRSRFRIASGAYLHKSAVEAIDVLHIALSKGRRIPREKFTSTTVNNSLRSSSKQSSQNITSSPSTEDCIIQEEEGRSRAITRSCGERELMTQVRFKSLAHFRRELRKFDRKYNLWRKRADLLDGRLRERSTMTRGTSTGTKGSMYECHDPC